MCNTHTHTRTHLHISSVHARLKNARSQREAAVTCASVCSRAVWKVNACCWLIKQTVAANQWAVKWTSKSKLFHLFLMSQWLLICARRVKGLNGRAVKWSKIWQNVEHMYHPLFALYTTDQDIPAGKSFLQFIFFKRIFLLVCPSALKYFSLCSKYQLAP